MTDKEEAALNAHDLRHRFGYVMVENTPLHRLAQIMGHDSSDIKEVPVQLVLVQANGFAHGSSQLASGDVHLFVPP